MNENLANVFNSRSIQSYRLHCPTCGGNLTPTRGIFTCRELSAEIDRRFGEADGKGMELCVSSTASASTRNLLPESSFHTSLFLSCRKGHTLRMDVAFEAGGTEVVVGEPKYSLVPGRRGIARGI